MIFYSKWRLISLKLLLLSFILQLYLFQTYQYNGNIHLRRMKSYSSTTSEIFTNVQGVFDSTASTYLTNFRQQPRSPLLGKLTSWLLRLIIKRKSDFILGLDVKVQADSSFDIIRGKAKSIDMSFEKLYFGQLLVSGGGKIIINDIDIKLSSLLFDKSLKCDKKSKDQKLILRKSYEIYGDFVLTQEDIINSKFIRGLIQILADTILQRVFGVDSKDMLRISIRRVSINMRRIYIIGDAVLANNMITSMPFEISTSIGVRDNGHVIYLKDIQVVFSPENVLLRTSIPVFPTGPIDVDIGEDCNIISFVIGERYIWIRMKTIISPVEPFVVSHPPRNALYRYDLSPVFSRVFRLTGGLLRNNFIYNNFIKNNKRLIWAFNSLRKFTNFKKTKQLILVSSLEDDNYSEL